MKEHIENFIVQALSKLDSTTVILLLPCALILYVCLFVPNEDIEKVLGIEETKKEIIEIKVTCPHCGKNFIYYHSQQKMQDSSYVNKNEN